MGKTIAKPEGVVKTPYDFCSELVCKTPAADSHCKTSGKD